MAQAKTLKGKSLLIKISDGATPAVYSHPCLINSDRGIVFAGEANETNVPDCADPELLSWVEREMVSKSATLNGAGTLNTPDVEEFFDWFNGGSEKAIRVELAGVTGANGGGYWQGNFLLTNFEITGSLGQKAQCSLTLQSTGAVTWTAAS
jgi:hypothetical protein